MCDDSGLAAGAALWAYHNLFDKPLIERDLEYPISPYLGTEYSPNDITNAINAARQDLDVEALGPASAQSAAQDIAANRVIGWFEGRSEIGPARPRASLDHCKRDRQTKLGTC